MEDAAQLMLASDQLQAQISYGFNVGARIREKRLFLRVFSEGCLAL